MPTRQRSNFTKRQALDADAQAWLRGMPCGFFEFQDDAALEALWSEHGGDIVEEHVEESPGTRPSRWWEFDAPRSKRGTYPGRFYDGQLCEPRLRVGGIGTPAYECRAVVPSFSYGLPDIWVGIDEDDPPIFESQAAYLKRHGLFLVGEGRRSSFEPETVSKNWDWGI